MQSDDQIIEPKIQRGIPIPHQWPEGTVAEVLRNALRKMAVGDCFDWPSNKEPYRAAKSLGMTVITRKINGSGYRVWRDT